MTKTKNINAASLRKIAVKVNSEKRTQYELKRVAEKAEEEKCFKERFKQITRNIGDKIEYAAKSGDYNYTVYSEKSCGSSPSKMASDILKFCERKFTKKNGFKSEIYSNCYFTGVDEWEYEINV